MASREGAVGRALADFDHGAFRERLTALVAIPSTSQEPAHAPDLERYLREPMHAWLARLGFMVSVLPNPEPGFGPILLAERFEAANLPSVLTYGHGDTVRGLDEQWRRGLAPWSLCAEEDRWYGRGTADNKGQHALNIAALEAVLAERSGKLGFNLRLLLETSEERGSVGLRAFVAEHSRLAADVLIASDGPRVAPETPTIATGTRGTFHFDLALQLRSGGAHSGHWGGLIKDPAVLLAHAIAAIIDRHGRILVRGWLPPDGVPKSVADALAGCAVSGGSTDVIIDHDWGEPGFSSAEKIYGWNSFIVLAMLSGQPGNPVNAVAARAHAHCQIRYTVDVDPKEFVPALRRHLDQAGLSDVTIENAHVRMPASRTDPADPWVRFTQTSIERTLGKHVQVIPNAAGGLPGDVFADLLGVPLVWVPHSYSGCGQHGPNEHLLVPAAREGIAAFAGLFWDLGEGATPPAKGRKEPASGCLDHE